MLCVCGRVCFGDQKITYGSQFFPSTMLVPEIKPRHRSRQQTPLPNDTSHQPSCSPFFKNQNITHIHWRYNNTEIGKFYFLSCVCVCWGSCTHVHVHKHMCEAHRLLRTHVWSPSITLHFHHWSRGSSVNPEPHTASLATQLAPPFQALELKEGQCAHGHLHGS